MFELVKVFCVLTTAFIILKSIEFECSKPLAFALVAIWLRFTLAAFHEYTHEPLLAGFSINALGSISVVLVGVLYLPKNGFLLSKFIPLYLFLLTVVVSGIYNAQIVNLLNVIVKWAYLCVLSLSILLAVRIHQINTTLLVLTKAFYLPIGLLILSVVLGESKATEQDGSTSYMGGYDHESSFSMIIVSFALIVSMVSKSYLRYRTALFYIAIFLLYLVNYRTSMLTVVPLILLFVFAGARQKIRPKYRIVVYSIITILLAITFYLISGKLGERFSDIGVLLSNWSDFLKAPAYFTQAERAIFSTRVYIWSSYLSEFFNASSVQQVFGHGPESWKGVFDLYAHNTYVSYLYEYGYFGISAFLGFVISIFVLAFRIQDISLRLKLLGSFVGFLIMNLATMPLWNIEGLITLSIILALVMSEQKAQTEITT